MFRKLAPFIVLSLFCINAYAAKVSSPYSGTFDGVDDDMSIGTLTIPTTGSISMWWRPGDTNFSSGAAPLWTTRQSSNIFDVYPFGNTIYAGWSAGADKRVAWAISGISVGTYYHVCLTWTNGGTTTLYINGVSVGTTSSLNATWSTATATSYVAKDGISLGICTKAIVDDIRLYNVALSGANVASITEGNAITSGLVGHWKFDEGSGTTVADSSGNGKTGNLNNGATFSSTVPKPLTTIISTYSLQLNNTGGGGFNNVSYNAATSWTFSGWINPYFDSTDSNYRIICGTGDASSGGSGIYIHQGSVQIYSSGVFLVASSTIPAQNAWSYIAVINDGANITIYINGVADNSAASANMGFSELGGAGNPESFDGAYDDFRIYGRAITTIELATLYNGQDINTTSIYAYWKFDDGSGTTAIDSSGGGAGNITLTGTETWLASPSVPLPLQVAVVVTNFLLQESGVFIGLEQGGDLGY